MEVLDHIEGKNTIGQQKNDFMCKFITAYPYNWNALISSADKKKLGKVYYDLLSWMNESF